MSMRYSEHLPRFTDLTLILTEQCNLACPFCYVPKTDRTMSREVALGAVEMLVERAPAGASLSVGFFGGEPFVARSLMQEVIAHGRKLRPSGLRFTTPTNGTLLDDAALDLIVHSGMRLALSVDRAEGPTRSLQQLASSASRLSRLSPVVRLTVTPDNVDGLFDTIAGCFEQGFSSIMHQPALEQRWPDSAVRAFEEQHRLLADWACERTRRGQALPRLSVLEGIIGRLGGKGSAYCGAGVRMAAVDPLGRIFGCYRSAYDPRAERLVLGDLRDGSVNETLLAAYARLHPHRARPESRGSCRGCEARDGCTVYCAAMGHVLLGDLRAVSLDACRLMRIQVSLCRDLVRRMGKLQREARRRRVGSRVAAAALALSLAGGAAGCGGDRTVTGDAVVGDGQGQQYMDGGGPGLCPISTDASADQMGPGLCPVSTDASADQTADQMGPGLCPHPVDATVDQTADKMVPGLCPHPVDATVDQTVDQLGPGLCPVVLDAATDQTVDQTADQLGPGLCPWIPPDGGMPGLC